MGDITDGIVKQQTTQNGFHRRQGRPEAAHRIIGKRGTPEVQPCFLQIKSAMRL